MDQVLDLVKSRVDKEVFIQVNEFKHQIENQYSKLSEMAELRKLIQDLSQKIVADSHQYVQQSVKDILTKVYQNKAKIEDCEVTIF